MRAENVRGRARERGREIEREREVNAGNSEHSVP